MTNNNKNTEQQAGNKYCIYVYILTIQFFYTKPTAYNSGLFGSRSIASVWFQYIGPLQIETHRYVQCDIIIQISNEQFCALFGLVLWIRNYIVTPHIHKIHMKT
jgi:hypothetical protein